MKLAIIGCGRISEKHCETINQISDISVVALSDISIDRMNIIKQKLNLSNNECTFFTDYEHLLNESNAELVVIATGSGSHFEIAKAAILAGKHTLIEKPLALSLSEASQLHEYANKHHVHLYVCYQLRFLNSMIAIKELIESGRLGTVFYGVCTLELNRSKEYYQGAAWRGTWEYDGGMLINQGIHLIDLLLWFMGDAKEVRGELMKVERSKETEDIAIGLVDFNSGARGLIEANTVTKPNNYGYSLKLFGEKGSIIIDGQQLEKISRFALEEIEVSEKELVFDKKEHVRMYRACIKAIKESQQHKSLVNGIEAQRSLELIFGLYQSALEKRVVDLPGLNFNLLEMKKWEVN
ncbi:Gfo/Idh/MocA family protein [Alkalihalobacillus pseudalcaliphilus]|uniref:Gfo/Idh/MocA family protein n=1 Tax=Alkalihalobacillus pseudalcaliphilus TaxID=79884 RepID=UPI0023605891|nr:Gfo/Idh/MocA family oxidoreductase [Alkalihalobacillus pseudalcaliphilus]